MSNATSLLKMVRGSPKASEPEVIEKNERLTRKTFIPKLLKYAGKIPFADDLAAAWYCAQDPATPVHVKGTLLAAIAYFVLPLDLIPDVIVGAGFTDDISVLFTALSIVGGSIKEQHRRKARRLLDIPEPG